MGDNSEILNYTIVLHQARKTLGITLTQYCIADCVYHLTNNPKSQIPGWCYASKEHIGKFLGITRQAVHHKLKPLIAKKIIEVSGK